MNPSSEPLPAGIQTRGKHVSRAPGTPPGHVDAAGSAGAPGGTRKWATTYLSPDSSHYAVDSSHYAVDNWPLHPYCYSLLAIWIELDNQG